MTLDKLINKLDSNKHLYENPINSLHKRDVAVEFAIFADENPSELYQYFTERTPENNTLYQVVYLGLSKYSTKHYQFIHAEINRVINAIKADEFDVDDFDVLEEIDLYKIHESDYEVFRNVMDDLINHLSEKNDDELNEYIIEYLEEIFDWLDQDLKKMDFINWKTKLF